MGFGSGSEEPEGHWDQDLDETEQRNGESNTELNSGVEDSTVQESEPLSTATEQTDTASSGTTAELEQEQSVARFSEVKATDNVPPRELARMLAKEEYHQENPAVPYATWRNGTAEGRDRITIELNSGVDDLVKSAMREFENRYDAEIAKADLREFAMVCGLMHIDEVFEMAEEWGLQYNS